MSGMVAVQRRTFILGRLSQWLELKTIVGETLLLKTERQQQPRQQLLAVGKPLHRTIHTQLVPDKVTVHSM